MPKKHNAATIKAAINPRDFYRYHLPDAKLKRYAWNDGGLCPFHNDSRAGSFRVNIENGAFKCYSCSASGGDIIAFTMALYELSFTDALAQLAQDWGIV